MDRAQVCVRSLVAFVRVPLKKGGGNGQGGETSRRQQQQQSLLLLEKKELPWENCFPHGEFVAAPLKCDSDLSN